jgi:hypothetical protein
MLYEGNRTFEIHRTGVATSDSETANWSNFFSRVQQGRKGNYLVLEFMRLAEEDGKMKCGDMVWGDFSVQEIILPCKRSSHKLLKS